MPHGKSDILAALARRSWRVNGFLFQRPRASPRIPPQPPGLVTQRPWRNGVEPDIRQRAFRIPE